MRDSKFTLLSCGTFTIHCGIDILEDFPLNLQSFRKPGQSVSICNSVLNPLLGSHRLTQYVWNPS